MSEQQTTPAQNYASLIVSTWSKKINSGLDKTCTMLQCVNRDYQADADKGTAEIKIATPKSVATGTYTGTLPAYSAASFSSDVLKLDQSLYFAFSVPDITQAQTNIALGETILEKAQKSIDEAIDKYIFSLNSKVDSDNIIQGQSSTPLTLSSSNVYSQFVSLAKLLKNSGALTAQKHGWVVVHPDVEEILLLCEQFSGASNESDKAKKEGSIGRIAGLDVFVSNNVGKDEEDDSYTIMAGTTEGITYASQLKKFEQIRAEQSFDTIVRGLYTFGALAVNPKALAVLKCEL